MTPVLHALLLLPPLLLLTAVRQSVQQTAATGTASSTDSQTIPVTLSTDDVIQSSAKFVTDETAGQAAVQSSFAGRSQQNVSAITPKITNAGRLSPKIGLEENVFDGSPAEIDPFTIYPRVMNLTQSVDILAAFVTSVVGVKEGCAASIVFDEGYAAEAGNVARHLSTEKRGFSFQFSSVDSYANDTHHTAAVQAGECRLFVLLLSSLTSLERLHSVTYLVGDVWDRRGHYLLLTPAPPGDAVASASGGVFENLAYYHIANPIGTPVRRIALWLYSGFDLSLRHVQGWKPDRDVPRLTAPAANFVGRRLKFVGFEHEPSNIYLDHTIEGEHVGMDYWLARALADVYNFTLDMREPTDGGKWGEALPNGTWIGLVGDVKERRAHFGIANIFLTLSRWKHVDYTRPYDYERACFAVWNKPPLPHWLAVIRPFSWLAWLMILSSLVVSVSALVVLARLAGGERSTFTSIPQAALYNFGVLLARTNVFEPRRAPSRSFDIGWRMAAMVLGFAYCAKLISFLSFPIVPAPLDTHRELAETGVEVGSWGGTLGELMAASTSPWDRQLATRYVPNYDFDNALRRVFAQDYSYIENRNTLIYYIQKYYTTKAGEKQLHIMDECFQNFMISVMLPKYSMLTDLFSRTILRVREAGLIPIWFRWSLDAVKSELVDIVRGSTSESRKRSLTLEHMQGVFLLLVLGWVLSFLAFVAEVAATRLADRKRTPTPTPGSGRFLSPVVLEQMATPPPPPAPLERSHVKTDDILSSM